LTAIDETRSVACHRADEVIAGAIDATDQLL
jgi:hypothetical protein